MNALAWLQAEAPPDRLDPAGPALRALDLALARWLQALDPAAPESLLLAAALLAHQEGRGHSCLYLPDVFDAPAVVHDGSGGPVAAVVERLATVGGSPAALAAAWVASPLLAAEHSPLVLHGQRLYLRRYWRCEAQVAAQVQARTARLVAEPEAGVARAVLERLFPPRGDAGFEGPFDWQKAACALSLRAQLTLITGGPGTGKTHTAARLLVLHLALHRGAEPLRVALAAPTGKAAARLRQSIAQALQGLQQQLGDAWPLPSTLLAPEALAPARTLHRLLGARPGTRRLLHDAAHPLDIDLLLLDEASMVHLEMMSNLLQALSPTARVVLLGDKDQLASVEAGAVLGDLCHGAAQGRYDDASAAWLEALTGQLLPADLRGNAAPLAQQTVMLRHSRRFDGPIGALAAAVNAGDAAAAAQALRQGGETLAWWPLAEAQAVAELALHGRAAAPGYRDYLALLAARPADAAAFDAWALQLLQAFDGFRVLCALREGPWGVAGLNASIEHALAAAGWLQPRSAWYEGRPLMVTRNEPDLGVYNGDIGLVLRSPSAALRAYFSDGALLHSVAVGRLAEVQTAWAMTVHKSQGSEFGHVALVLPEDGGAVLSRELLYTGITRARQAFTLAGSRWGVLAEAVQRVTRRSSGLRDLLPP